MAEHAAASLRGCLAPLCGAFAFTKKLHFLPDFFYSRILPLETLTCSRCDVHFLLQPRDPVDFELPTELIVEQNFHGATNISQSPNITAVVDCEGETSELCTSLLFTAGPGIDAGPGESTPTPGPALVNGSLHSALPNQTCDAPNVCSHARGANETVHEASPGVSTPFQIFVQTPSGLLTVDVDPSTLIGEVSNAVVVKLGRPASEFRLHFGGKVLDACMAPQWTLPGSSCPSRIARSEEIASTIPSSLTSFFSPC